MSTILFKEEITVKIFLGINNIVSVPNSPSEEQEILIVDAVGSQGKAVLMFDGDKAGQECKDDVLARLVTQVTQIYTQSD